MYKKAYLFLNGEPPTTEILKKISEEVSGSEILTVCADGAFCYIKNYFLPKIFVGDFDSVSKNEIPNGIEIISLPPEKDYTDGHIATEYILEKGIKDITIYGGGGRRADHTQSNYSLLALAAKHDAVAKMDNGEFIIFLAKDNFEVATDVGKIISLVPYTDEVHIINTKGLKYPIDNRVLDKIHILGISNVASSCFVGYMIASGTALVFLEK